MSEAGLNPAEAILRLCAAAAPEPWYPRLYAKQTGVDLDSLAMCLEELWMDGLLRKTAGTAETGPGISLTAEGERVLHDPQALQRLRDGQPLSPHDRGGLIRQALRAPLRPYVTLVLVLLNVLVFAGGYYVARQHEMGNAFLRGDQKTLAVQQLLERSGSLAARNLIDGEWWRLVTAGFVHIGFMHILFNMVFLYLAGRYIELMWGHVRYLVIYLAGALGGSCLAVAHNVGGIAGASGAVCGLLGAEAVWVLFNRRYLPRGLFRQARWSLITSAIMLVFISSFDGVSGWGHFGGAVAGALAAMLLHLHRFGPPGWRWLAVAAFVPLGWLGYHVIDRARATDPNWHEVEAQQFVAHFRAPIRDAMKKADKLYSEEVSPILLMHPTRRDPAKVEAVLSILAEQERELNALAERLTRAGPYRDKDAEAAREASHEYVTAGADQFALAQRVLRQGDKPTGKDSQALREQREKVRKLRDNWEDWFVH